MSNNLEALEAELSDLEKAITSENQQEAAEQEESSKETNPDMPAEAASESQDEETTAKGEEWFVPGKFRTAEDLKRSYEYLQAHTTRQSQELSQLRRQTSQPTHVDPAEDPEIIQFAEAVKQHPLEAIRNIVRAEKEREQAVLQEQNYSQLLQTKLLDPEFKELAPEITNIILEVSSKSQIIGDYLNNAKDPVVLELLETLARSRRQPTIIQAERQKAAKEGEQKALKKKRAGIEGSSSSAGYEKKDPYDMSLEELEAEIKRGNL